LISSDFYFNYLLFRLNFLFYLAIMSAVKRFFSIEWRAFLGSLVRFLGRSLEIGDITSTSWKKHPWLMQTTHAHPILLSPIRTHPLFCKACVIGATRVRHVVSFVVVASARARWIAWDWSRSRFLNYVHDRQTICLLGRALNAVNSTYRLTGAD